MKKSEKFWWIVCLVFHLVYYIVLYFEYNEWPKNILICALVSTVSLFDIIGLAIIITVYIPKFNKWLDRE